MLQGAPPLVTRIKATKFGKKQQFEESFARSNLQVNNSSLALVISISIADKCHFRIGYYLERGLNYFPNHPRTVNNLALF